MGRQQTVPAQRPKEALATPSSSTNIHRAPSRCQILCHVLWHLAFSQAIQNSKNEASSEVNDQSEHLAVRQVLFCSQPPHCTELLRSVISSNLSDTLGQGFKTSTNTLQIGTFTKKGLWILAIRVIFKAVHQSYFMHANPFLLFLIGFVPGCTANCFEWTAE